MQARQESIKRSRKAFNLDDHAVGVVANKAGETFFLRKPVDEWTKANALHDPTHADLPSP